MIPAPGPGSRRAGLALVGVAEFLYFGLHFSTFWTSGTLDSIALASSAVLVASLGTMALLITGNVDLSIGSQYAFIGVVTATVVRGSGSPLLGVLTAVGVGAVLGLVNGMLSAWLPISPLIVTLAMLAVYRGLAYAAAGGNPVLAQVSGFTSIGQSRWWGTPVPVVVSVAVFVLGSALLVTTVGGLRLFAIGGDRAAARLLGIRVNRLVVATYTVNGALIGIVALLATARLGSGSPDIGVDFEVDVLTAVVLGGVLFTGGAGHPFGVLVAVATIGVLDAGLVFEGLADWYQQIAHGALLLLALVSDQLLHQLRSRRRLERAGPREHGTPTEAVPRPREVLAGAASLELTGVCVAYDGGLALDHADLRVGPGEVVCLVGDNGAGKSTLVKAVAGALVPTSGAIRVGGRQIGHRPQEVRALGLETVFQELAVFANLTIIDNVTICAPPSRRMLGIVRLRDHGAATVTTRSRLERLGAGLPDLSVAAAELSGGQRQAVAIARALRPDVQIIVLDEPTAALSARASAEVLDLVGNLSASGRGVLLVSHDIEDVFEVADRVVVLELGRVIFDGPIGGLDRLELLRLMSGRAGGAG